MDPALPTIFSTGGSLGAKGINEAIATHIEEFGKAGTQLIWQTGKPFAQQASNISAGHKTIWTSDFVSHMEYAFAAADVVISRSGAMSIAELCVAAKPVVFVPFPFAAEDHQTVNAQHLVDRDAGLLIRDSDAKNTLVPTALNLSKDKAKLETLKTNIGRLAITDAADRIAREILNRTRQ